MRSAAIATTFSLAVSKAEGSLAAKAERPPVLLIHGLKDDRRKMEPMARYLRAQGRTVHTLSLIPSWGQLGLDELALQVKAYADETFAAGEKFDLVGFSMGGLVTRYYLQRLGGLERVHRFVTIAAPHQGSVLAWVLPNAGGRQMRPGSTFLQDLDRDADQLQRLGFTSIWTPLDLTILPAKSSIHNSAKCTRLWCVAHPLMVMQPSCLAAVRAALDGEV